MKRCTRCGIEKAESEFHKKLGGHNPHCKECRRGHAAKHARKRRSEHPLRDVAYRFGLAEAELALMFAGGCFICGDMERLVVDHDHRCCPRRGQSCGDCVRGVLCNNCNAALGFANDDPTRLMRMASYLASHQVIRKGRR